MAGLQGFQSGFQMADGFIRGREQNARANNEQEMRKENFDLQKQATQRKLDKDLMTQVVAAKINGIDVDENDPQIVDLYKRNPMLKFSHIADEKTVAATDFAEGLAKGTIKGDLFSPEAASHVDALYAPMIQKDDGLKRRVIGIYPGKTPETLSLDLEITDAEGNVRNAPMTKRRSIDDDDEIMQIPITDLVNTAQATRQLQQSMMPAIQAHRSAQSQQGGLSPNQLAYARAIGVAPQTKSYEMVEREDGAVLQKDQDGKYSMVLGRAPAEKTTAQQQNFDFLKQNGMSEEEAYKAAFKPSLGRQASAPRAQKLTATGEYMSLVEKYGQEKADVLWDRTHATGKGKTSTGSGVKTSSKLADLNALQSQYGEEEGMARFKNLYPERATSTTNKGLKISEIDKGRISDLKAEEKSATKALDDNGWMMSPEEKSAAQENLKGIRTKKEELYGKYDSGSAKQERTQEPGAVKQSVPRQSAPLKTPNPGEVINGFKYNGGDPARQSNWSKI